MTTFSHIRKVCVPQSVVDSGHSHLYQTGLSGNEGMVLWVGKTDGTTFEVREALAPRQRGVRTADGVCVMVDGDELQRINMALYRAGLVLFGQLHSHPGRAYHSSTDDAFAVATTIGSLSLVVPNFARQPFSLADTAVYQLDATGHWCSLSNIEITRLIVITDG